jgi:hypothetical protein
MSFVTHEFGVALTYLSFTIFTITCISHVFVTHEFYKTHVSQKTWDTHLIVKMVSDTCVSVTQNSCVTKDMGYTCDCKDGE